MFQVKRFILSKLIENSATPKFFHFWDSFRPKATIQDSIQDYADQRCDALLAIENYLAQAEFPAEPELRTPVISYSGRGANASAPCC